MIFRFRLDRRLLLLFDECLLEQEIVVQICLFLALIPHLYKFVLYVGARGHHSIRRPQIKALLLTQSAIEEVD